jgi:site-specific recombinase XerC
LSHAFNRERRTLQLIGKGDQLRTIDLPDAAFDLISSLDPEELIFCDEAGAAFKDPAGLFCRLRKKVEDRALVAGKSHRRSRFHDLRHDFAVKALRS